MTERSRAAWAAIAVAALLAALAPSPATVAGADDAAVVLPGRTYSVMTVDLDGDGSRELVRITSEPEGDGRVEAWDYGRKGWATLGSASLQRHDEAGGAMPVELTRDPAALLAWRVEGSASVLVITAGGTSGQAFGSACCLTISEVRREDGGIALHPLPTAELAASFVQAADLDGDGTDELILLESSRTPTGPQRLKILRWSGAALEVALEREDAGEYLGVTTGNSDGIPGDDVLLGPTAAGRLERIVWIDGEPLTEATDLNLARPFDGWIAGLADGAMMVALSDGVRALRWPRGEAAAELGRLDSLLFPSVFAVGDGSETVIVSFDAATVDAGEPPRAMVYDIGLRPLGEVEGAAAATRLWDLASDAQINVRTIERPLFPYVGPIPDGWSDGRPAFVANGVLILAGGTTGFETRPIATMAGLRPIGFAGPDGEWMALTDTFGFDTQQVYLFAGPGAGAVTLVPVAGLLRPDEELQIASLQLRNAVETDAAVDGVRPLLADGDGFEVVVTAPPGSRVLVLDDWRSEDYEVGSGPLMAEIRAPRMSQTAKDQPLDVRLVVVTPEGRVSTTSWKGTFVREPPTLSVSVSTEEFALRARLEGRVSPGVAVTANGAPLETDVDGRFAVAIDAPIWPSAVRVTARDPLGNEATELLEVVGFLDYRGLPWPAFVVVATIVAGLVLYVRVPRPRRDPVEPAVDGDPRLEEIELDAAQRRL